MRFGSWNIRSLYRVGAIKSVVGELKMCKLDLVGVQEVRWEGEGYQTADNCTLHYSTLHYFLQWAYAYLVRVIVSLYGWDFYSFSHVRNTFASISVIRSFSSSVPTLTPASA
jgi:hypothetical protein